MDYTRWMENHYQALKDRKIKELCFPGTHDSGTSTLGMAIAPDATDVVKTLFEKSRVGGATGIGTYIQGMAVAQDRSLYGQLQLGIRYLDLRVCCVGGEFYTCHSLLGATISSLLEEMKRFLSEHPKEMIIVKVGFKAMDDAEKARAKLLFESVLGGLYRFCNAVSFMDETFENQLASGVRALFVSDSGSNIVGTYSEEKTTNGAVVSLMKSMTQGFHSSASLLEAQCIRPVSEKDYILGYVQAYGCRLLPFLSVLMAVPVVGPTLAAAGCVSIPTFILYLKNASPLPSDLKENALDSRSIIKNYYGWLAENPQMAKPTLTLCDFPSPEFVEIAIALSLGQGYSGALNHFKDTPPQISPAERLVIFECTADAVASAFYTAGYLVNQAADFIDENIPGVTGEVLATALHGAGYTLAETGGVLIKLYGYTEAGVSKVLEGAGYAANQVADWTSGAATDAYDWSRGAAESTVDWTKGAAGSVAGWTTGAAEDVANWTTDAAGSVGNWTTGAANSVASWTSGAAKDVAKWTTDSGKKVADTFNPSKW